MRITVPFPRVLMAVGALILLLTLAVPPPHSLAVSVDAADGNTAADANTAATDSTDSSSPAWTVVAGSVIWEADLAVGSDGNRLGYSPSFGGDLTDGDLSWQEATHNVTGFVLTQPEADSGSATMTFEIDPALGDGASSLRLWIGSVGLNLADASVDAGQYTWNGVGVDWERGDTIAVTLEEFPLNFTPRAFNGRANNLENPTWGMAGTALLKKAPDAYADGVSTPTASRPNARTISNLVFAQDESVPNSSQASDITWQWGQFIDHDITLSPDNPDESFAIDVPLGDPVFDPDSTGKATIALQRSVTDPDTGTSADNPRRQTNALTAFIDGSQVYGSDRTRAHALRTNDGTGKLKTSNDGRFLPYNEDGLDNEGGADLTTLFVAGDVRVNEQIGLIAMHTLFAREHNRLANIIATDNPDLSGDDIYELARKIVGAHIQNITFSEFLPLLLGPDAIGIYDGYDSSVDPTIASEFSAGAYRVGHTLLSPELNLVDDDGESSQISLRNAFFDPSFYDDHSIAEVLRGFAAQRAQEVDAKVIDDIRNFLLRGPHGPAFDLAALNIQRSRDHGVADYNTVRSAYGLDPASSFADITSDADVQQALEDAYGDVDDVDLWPGALAEDHVSGASVGETLRAVISEQFRRLRDGDRFWFENDPFFVANPDLTAEIRSTTLADIIRRNTSAGDELSDNVFVVD